MEEIYSNVDYEKSVDSEPSRHQTGPRSSERKCYRAVIVILGLLSVFLLAGCIGIRVHCHGSVQASNDKLFALMQERDHLKTNLTEVIEERDHLKTNLTEITEENNKLQTLYKKKKTCPAGWKIFGCSCYFLSSKSGSWTTAQEDCENKEADLVVIDSAEEQTFLLGFTNVDTWIGLTDREKENTWKWIDGSPLTVKP
ncbi:C-type lectin domain family 4 member M-like isoform X2 [Anabas testudineus]|uniref:C-type lectin domain family 4 member M-like isoform X2 n=1 Tax=Anabas testudineus TaxID=64144 RepID=UPI000E45727D|nr:C-type lectin domain family 4 member M-like isoform X2 [Anabas testudineus]